MNKILHTLKIVFFVAVTAVMASSCREEGFEKIEIPTPNPGGETGTRTVLVYMLADNSLNEYLWANIDQMLKGLEAAGSDAANSNLLVYIDPKTSDPTLKTATTTDEHGSVPRLFHLSVDAYGNPQREVIKYYEERFSGSGEALKEVIDEVVALYPADEYGLILSAHGLSWIPASAEFGASSYSAFSTMREYDENGLDADGLPMTKYLGPDGSTKAGNFMEVEDMLEGIADNKFKFIVFDACYMASVELLYELRNKAEYFIASTSEIYAPGFAYEYTVPLMLAPSLSLEKVADAFYKFYAEHSSEVMHSVTVSLIKSSEMKNLAPIMREIIQANKTGAKNITLSSVQRFDRNSYRVMFDLGHYVSQIATQQQAEALNAQMRKTAIYTNHTDIAFTIPINHYSGLAIYIPSPSSGYTSRNEAYTETEWYQYIWE